MPNNSFGISTQLTLLQSERFRSLNTSFHDSCFTSTLSLRADAPPPAVFGVAATVHRRLFIGHCAPSTAREGLCRRIHSASTMPVKALYPGTFDPPTNGHVDLIQRGSKLFGHLTVAILVNPVKNPLSGLVEERVEMLEEVTGRLGNVSVATFDGLMVGFARTSARPPCCAAFEPSPITST